MNESELRRRVLDTARALAEAGLNKGSAGNVSARCGEGFLVTPSGLAYEKTRASDIVPVAMDGAFAGRRAPSSEWRFHRDIYAARPEAGAVVHAHSPFATALACLERDIPAFHYMIARFGGATVRCAPYATFGTQALSDHALAALAGRNACLLGHHGMLVFGADLDRALDLAMELETLSEQYWRALQIGEPSTLPEDEMALVLEKFKTYGKQASR
ncbi:MAG: class II aldolase/adducin family protein [Rhodocyclaceae bacterium]|nr:class II aldolase/adducin family protein [Rhodocyclaceae bacterium]